MEQTPNLNSAGGEPRFRLSAEPYSVLDILTSGPDPDCEIVTEIAAVSFESGRIVDADDAVILPPYPADPSGDLLLQYGPEVLRRARRAVIEPFWEMARHSIGNRTMVSYDPERMRELLGTGLPICGCRTVVAQIFGHETLDDVDRERIRLGGAYRRAVYIGSVFFEILRTTEIAQPHLRLRDFLLFASREPDEPWHS
jgi:hypothetical protein